MSLFVARQPIFDGSMNVVAYELLFRDSASGSNSFPSDMDGDIATTKLISGLQFNNGLASLTDNKLAFINFTHKAIIEGKAFLFSPEQIVVEILETARPTKRLLESIKHLYEKGYTIALDDYVDDKAWHHFFPFVKIIKLDMLQSGPEQLSTLQRLLVKYPHIQLLAEKVEEHSQYQSLREKGVQLFQGYFFSHPVVIESRTLSVSQTTITRLITMLMQQNTELEDIQELIESDSGLSYKLLRYVQSPLFKRRGDIQSIKQATVALGIAELKRFSSLLFTNEMGKEKHSELNKLALYRAKFCELIDQQLGNKSPTGFAFMTGLLSLMDAMLDGELIQLIAQIPIHQDVKEAICSHKGRLGAYLSIAKHYENNSTQATDDLLERLSISDDRLNELYIASLQWAVEQTVNEI